MNTPERQLRNLEWVGAHPALDFVNTVHAWNTSDPEDYLHDFNDLLAWNQTAGLIEPGHGTDLGRTAAGHAADAALEEGRRLRETLHSIFSAVSAGLAVPAAALQHLNAVLRTTARWRRLASDGDRLRMQWNFADAPAYALLGPVAWEAANLLECGPLDRIKACPPPEGCGWLFLDTSRNRSRTWCSMRTCGNSAKVRRYRRRREQGKG